VKPAAGNSRLGWRGTRRLWRARRKPNPILTGRSFIACRTSICAIFSSIIRRGGFAACTNGISTASIGRDRFKQPDVLLCSFREVISDGANVIFERGRSKIRLQLLLATKLPAAFYTHKPLSPERPYGDAECSDNAPYEKALEMGWRCGRGAHGRKRANRKRHLQEET